MAGVRKRPSPPGSSRSRARGYQSCTGLWGGPCSFPRQGPEDLARHCGARFRFLNPRSFLPGQGRETACSSHKRRFGACFSISASVSMKHLWQPYPRSAGVVGDGSLCVLWNTGLYVCAAFAF